MIDWGAFLTVAIATLVGAVIVVGMYSLGVRLYAVSEDGESTNSSAKVGAYACFTVCAAAVLYGIYLVIPFFH